MVTRSALVLLGYASDLEEAVSSEETNGPAGIAERPDLTWATRLEVDCELRTPAAWAEVVDGLLEVWANTPMLCCCSVWVIGPLHHDLSLY
jgi:hypothetical protein